jgi:glycosyltransferase involved in cell wall biosynthesis
MKIAASSPTAAADPRRAGLVYFGNEWFAENRTSSHHMARQLATQAPLIYVDSPGMRAPSGSGRDLKRAVRKLLQACRRPRLVQPGLWHCTVPQLPWRRVRVVGWLNRLFGSWAVRRAVRHVGLQDPILWFVVPHPAFMLDSVPHSLAVYYCVDDYAAHPGVDAAIIQACDAELTRRADHVFVAPPALVEAKKAVNPATTYSPHGVDIGLFNQAAVASTAVPAAAAGLAGPVIGYFGSIAAWTDVDLLLWLATERPAWQFLLIGHASADVAALRARPNVSLVGAQPYETLPAWAKAFDVAIIPYRLNRQVQNANPLKLREYLATGKPIVSVATPEIEQFGDLVRVAHGREEFLQAIDAALREDDAAQAGRRMDSVRQMSWEHRAETAFGIAGRAWTARAERSR